MYAVGEVGGLSLPFIPFTFPTVMFRRLAVKFGYESLTWAVIDRVWAVYKRGRAAGDIPLPSTAAGDIHDKALSYLVAQGVPRDQASKWLWVADAAADEWWGQGTFFSDFGASGGVVGAVGGVVQGGVNVVRSVTDAMISGAARSLGIPRWIAIIGVLLALALVVFVVVKLYFPGALRLR